jgi:NADH-quinone oxidoreductase subunit C
MTDSLETLHSQLRDFFGDKLATSTVKSGQITIEVLPDDLIAVCTSLRDEEAFHFEQLIDICGVDYLSFGKADWETQSTTDTGFSRGVEKAVYDEHKAEEYPARFAAVYHLLSIKNNHRLRIRSYIDSVPPVIDSVIDIWSSANWFEREAFDLMGILFKGHPDLRRILTDYGFIGNPFRKDFPLVGNVEVRYDPDKKRVVYQPVTIENRILVPKVIRHDNRYESPEEDASDV